jgi:hypothetical protein
MKPPLLILLIATLTFFACRTPRFVYSPSVPNQPIFKEEGDSKFAGYYSIPTHNTSPSEGYGCDVQAAYAVTDHWAVTANFFKRKEKDEYLIDDGSSNPYFESSVVRYTRNLLELGGGYYTPLDRFDRFFFNFYTGFGFGKFSFDDRGVDKDRLFYTRNHKANVFKWYLQPGFSLTTYRYFTLSMLARFSFVRYSNVTTNYNNEELEYFFLKGVRNKTLSFFEPTFQMHFAIPGWEWLKLESGMTLSGITNQGTLADSRLFCFSFGASFDFLKLKQ